MKKSKSKISLHELLLKFGKSFVADFKSVWAEFKTLNFWNIVSITIRWFILLVMSMLFTTMVIAQQFGMTNSNAIYIFLIATIVVFFYSSMNTRTEGRTDERFEHLKDIERLYVMFTVPNQKFTTNQIQDMICNNFHFKRIVYEHE